MRNDSDLLLNRSYPPILIGPVFEIAKNILIRRRVSSSLLRSKGFFPDNSESDKGIAPLGDMYIQRGRFPFCFYFICIHKPGFLAAYSIYIPRKKNSCLK